METPKCLIESDVTIVAPLLFTSFLAGDEHADTSSHIQPQRVRRHEHRRREHRQHSTVRSRSATDLK